MEQRQLGQSDLFVSTVGLGCNNFGLKLDQDGTNAVVARSLELGINFFDTADVYEGDQGNSEILLGRALGNRRQDVLIGTKFGGAMNGPAPEDGGSRTFIMSAVEDSLTRLGTDYIDLYQYHKPDGLTPIEETLRALEDLVKQGKVRYIGCSNFDGALLADADDCSSSNGLSHFVSAQNRYSLITRGIETDLVSVCKERHVGILPFFPLESGLLTGKYRPGSDAPKGSRFDLWGDRIASTFMTEASLSAVDKLRAICERIGEEMVTVAMGWLVHRPAVASVIAGATTPAQVEQNVRGGAWVPPEDIGRELDGLI